MLSRLGEFEQTIEREMRLLAQLPAIAPDAACMARVQAAVCAEARSAAPARRVRRWRAPLGIAAAVALLVCWLSLPQLKGGGGPAELALGEWAAAFEETNAGLTDLLASAVDDSEEERELSELLDSLRDSLSEFEGF